MIAIKTRRGKVLGTFEGTYKEVNAKFREVKKSAGENMFIFEGETTDGIKAVHVYFPYGMKKAKFFETPADEFLKKLGAIERKKRKRG